MGTKFKLPKSANTYWNKLNDNSSSNIEDNVKLNFYWLCAQLGIAYDKRVALDGVELVDKFTTKLDPHSSMVRGLFLAAVWRYRKIKKKDIQDQFTKLLAADNYTKISNDGLELMDNFAGGGFQLIEERISSKNGWNYFMLKYHQLMEKAPTFEYKVSK